MKKIIKKTLALAVSLVLLFGVLDLPIYSASAAEGSVAQNSLDLSEYTFDNIPDQLLENITSNVSNESQQAVASTYSLNNTSATSSSSVPTVVGLSADSADDLTSLTVINSDGSKTLHRYFENIKFIDEAGKIRFKDNGIYDSNTNRILFDDYAFENGDNDIKTFYPDKISDGLKLETNNLEFSMKPIITEEEEELEKDAALSSTDAYEECIEYEDVFGTNTALQYIPTYKGFKENLVFDSHPGKNEFSFEINTNGLIPASMSGTSIPLLSPENNEQVALLHPVDMKDSFVDENGISNPKITLDNSISLTATQDESSYILTIHLNQSFLDDTTTVYPVIVDPTVSVDISNAQSVSVCSNGDRFLDNISIGKFLIGKHYAYIKTNSMQNYTFINTNLISSAYYRTYEFSDVRSQCVIEVYDTWFTTPVNQVTYDMCNDAVTSYNPVSTLHLTNIYGKMWYNIPITDLVVSWIDAETSPDYIFSEEYGFVLNLNTTENNKYKCFYPPGATVNPPSIVINYTEDTSLPNGLYYIKNVMSGRYLDVESARTNVNNTNINVITFPFQGSLNELWKVEHKGNGWYEMYSMYEFTNRQYLNNSNSAAKTTQATSDSTKFRIVQNPNGFDYRIFSKSAATNTMVLDMTNYEGSANHWRRVGIFEFHGGNNQRWEFEPIEYSATVQDFYDNGMLTRWSMTNAQMQNGIKHWQNLAKNFYLNQFGLNLTFSNPALFTSLADDCGYSTIAKLDSECTHSTNHKLQSAVYNDFKDSYSLVNKKILTLWTGHTTFSYDEDGELIEKNNVGVHTGPNKDNMGNATIWPGSRILMQNSGNNGGTPNISFTANTMRARRTYLHELAHAFGAVDSYCKGKEEGSDICADSNCVECYESTSPYDADCIMAKLEPSGMSNDMSTWLCAQCKEDIKTHLMKYYHQEH